MKDKSKLIYFVTTCIFLILLIMSFVGYDNKSINQMAVSILEPVKEETLEQTFISKVKDMKVLKLQVATYQENIKKGTLTLELYNNKNKLLKKSTYKLKNIGDNNYVHFKTNLKNTLNKKYKLKIKVRDIKNKRITFYTTNYDEKGYDLKREGKKLNCNIILTETYENNGISFNSIWYIFLYIAIMYLLILINQKGDKDEKK